MYSKKRIDFIIMLLGCIFILISLSSAFYIRSVNIKNATVSDKNQVIAMANQNKEDKQDIKKFTLTIENKYKLCGHSIKETKLLDKGFKNRGDLQNEFKDYRINNFSNGSAEISKDIDGYCPKHYVMKIKDGVVVIFFKEPQNDNKLIKEITTIKTEDLSYEDAEELKQGIEIYSDDSLYQKLEEIGS